MIYLFAALFSITAMAADAGKALTVSPHITKKVGEQKASGTYAQCMVTAGDTILMDVVSGDSDVDHISHKKNDLKEGDLKTLILGARSEPLNTAFHITETIPNVSIVTGISNYVPDYKLLSDAGVLVTRKGPNSTKLLQIVEKECGKLKAPAQPREK